MIVNRTAAERLLKMSEKEQISELRYKNIDKPFRICRDCLDDVKKFDPKMNIQPLTKRDKEVTQWKCSGKHCGSQAALVVDADAYDKARRANPVRESKNTIPEKKQFRVNHTPSKLNEEYNENACEHCGNEDLEANESYFLRCNRCGKPTRAKVKE